MHGQQNIKILTQDLHYKLQKSGSFKGNPKTGLKMSVIRKYQKGKML